MTLHNELQELNTALQACPEVYKMLSGFGRRIYFSESGVLAQSWEARERAFVFNATLGEAQSNHKAIYSDTLHRSLSGFAPDEIYPYAAPGGLKELRELWLKKMLRENPSMAGFELSLPVVTAGLTHGLSLMADLFLDQGDTVAVHDKHWENYELIFGVRCGCVLAHYPMFKEGGFNIEAMENCIRSCTSEKVFVVLNFPNNPTGYAPSREEALEIAAALVRCAETGKKLVVLCDDAYYGFWYSDDVMRESLFGLLANAHPSILAIRLDGATKEAFAGGLRVGFVTFGGKTKEILTALEKKTIGAIRACISSNSRPSQSILLHGLKNSEYQKEIENNYVLLRQRGREVMELCKKGSRKNLWRPYPYNSGYFLCIKVGKNAQALRRYLLAHYGIGVIACSREDIRISVPCIEIEEIKKFFEILDDAIENA